MNRPMLVAAHFVLSWSWLALPSVSHAQSAAPAVRDNGPAPAVTARSDAKSDAKADTKSDAKADTKAEIKADAKADARKPQVRTYSSVTVVSDPAQVPRLPLPNRLAGEPRESVRALRQEIQEMRRSLRQERPDKSETAAPSGVARPEGVRREKAGAQPSPGSAAEPKPSAGTDRPAAGALSSEPTSREPREAPARRERETRDPDAGRMRPLFDGRPRSTL